MASSGAYPLVGTAARVIAVLGGIILLAYVFGASPQTELVNVVKKAAAGSSSDEGSPAKALKLGGAPRRAPVMQPEKLGAFDALQAGIQQYTIWGNLPDMKGIALHAWVRFVCTKQDILVRGFAIAEETTEEVSFFLMHPYMAPAARKDLPQLQMLLGNGTWVRMQQMYKPEHLWNQMNVIHFEQRLPRSAEVRQLGVAGWQLSVDVLFHNGRCDTPEDAEKAVGWRKPGTMWNIISAAQPSQPDIYAYVVEQHLKHHLTVGMSGTVIIVEDWQQPAIILSENLFLQQAVKKGQLYFWVWDALRFGKPADEHRPGEEHIYYPQSHMYNAALLAAFGSGVRLTIADLDEWLIIANGTTLAEALSPGGCMHGHAQIRIGRHDVVNARWGSISKGRGDVRLWQDPKLFSECHEWLKDYCDLGASAGITWKSLVNPDRITMYHSHHGWVLNSSYPAASSSNLPDHAYGQSKGPELEMEKNGCAYWLHFVNLFRARRPVPSWMNSTGPDPLGKDWRDTKHVVATCKRKLEEESKKK